MVLNMQPHSLNRYFAIEIRLFFARKLCQCSLLGIDLSSHICKYSKGNIPFNVDDVLFSLKKQ